MNIEIFSIDNRFSIDLSNIQIISKLLSLFITKTFLKYCIIIVFTLKCIEKFHKTILFPRDLKKKTSL